MRAQRGESGCDESLRGVATFSARNNWDPLIGLDDAALYREWMQVSEQATVVESMLVALGHMQVSVCYLRTVWSRPGRALPAFHKNIICFPQDLTELKRLRHFATARHR
jgi:hypothetical protein